MPQPKPCAIPYHRVALARRFRKASLIFAVALGLTSLNSAAIASDRTQPLLHRFRVLELLETRSFSRICAIVLMYAWPKRASAYLYSICTAASMLS